MIRYSYLKLMMQIELLTVSLGSIDQPASRFDMNICELLFLMKKVSRIISIKRKYRRDDGDRVIYGKGPLTLTLGRSVGRFVTVDSL